MELFREYTMVAPEIIKNNGMWKRYINLLLEYMTLSKILCKWKQDSVVSFFLYLDSVFKNKHKLVHNQPPV